MERTATTARQIVMQEYDGFGAPFKATILRYGWAGPYAYELSHLEMEMPAMIVNPGTLTVEMRKAKVEVWGITVVSVTNENPLETKREHELMDCFDSLEGAEKHIYKLRHSWEPINENSPQVN